MTTKQRGKLMIWLRRCTQIASLFFFLFLFWSTRHQKGQVGGQWLMTYFHLDPLILLTTWLSNHTVPVFSLLALITVVLTLLMGRVFCGWVCPLGVIHAAASHLGRRKRGARHPADEWSPWQRPKYYFLFALLILSLFGAHWIGVFDPLSLLYRTTTIAVAPAVEYALDDSASAIYEADPHVGSFQLTDLTEPVYRFMRKYVFVVPRQSFIESGLVLVLFVTIVLLNIYRRRFWCRYVCPLGALLGLLSKRPVVRLSSVSAGCSSCGLCAMKCPAAASPDKPNQWRPTECYACWNCVGTCNSGAITFRVGSPFKPVTLTKLDMSRRAVLNASAGGILGLLFLRLSPQAQGKAFNQALIRPPGSREEREFVQRCIQCGACMKTCPTNGLQPTFLEAGLEGIWTPMLVPKIGYCEYNCNACGQVCPVQAIQPLPMEEKHKVKIGLASFDTSRCLPYAYNKECMVCEEHCPLPKKAIYVKEKEVTLRNGRVITIKVPYVDANLCIGCGICESKCVYKDLPAIRVTSANESRNTNNQPVLQGLSDDEASSDGTDISSVPSSSSSSNANDPYK